DAIPGQIATRRQSHHHPATAPAAAEGNRQRTAATERTQSLRHQRGRRLERFRVRGIDIEAHCPMGIPHRQRTCDSRQRPHGLPPVDKQRRLADDRSMDGPEDPSADRSGLAPTLLLAMPQLRDPNFTRSVVLLCEHGSKGALGFVVNRPTDVRAASAVALDPPPKADSGMLLWSGGPGETQRGFLLLGEDPGVAESERICDGMHLTASVEVLRQLIEADPSVLTSRRCRLLLGYAGWGPGQLDRELAQSAWLTAPADSALV